MAMSDKASLDAMVTAYTSGPMFDQWSRYRDSGLHPEELALVRTHCRDLGATILNLGCGSGRETFGLYRMGYHNVQGADCTAALLRIAKQGCGQDGPRIAFTLAEAAHLPFVDATFDVVTYFENLYGHITPASSRLTALREARRVLKPGGLALMIVTSLYDVWRYAAVIRLFEVVRKFYNPQAMERGDKWMKSEGLFRRKRGWVARSHWFRPNEVPADAAAVGLTVVQTTTIAGILRNPTVDLPKTHGGGRLIYVLKRPA